MRATVQAGGKVEVVVPGLEEGQTVEVDVRPVEPQRTIQSIHEILDKAKGHRAFQSAEEVDAYIRELRDEWD